MAGGTGPQIIQPGSRQIWQNLTGTWLNPNQRPDQENWFGSDPMGSSARWMDFARAGGGVSYGPQSTQYQRSGFPLAEPGGAGLMGALFGSSYGQGFGESAYDRFQDSGDSYLRRFGTDLTDANGNVIGFSPERGAGARSMSTFGGRNAFNDPLTGQNYGGHREFAGLQQLQQGANKYLNDPATAANMVRFQEIGSPYARANPQEYMGIASQAEGLYPTTADMGNAYVSQMQGLGGEGVNSMAGMTGDLYGQTVGGTDQVSNSLYGQTVGGTDEMTRGLYGDVTSAIRGIAGNRYGGTVGDVQGLTNKYETQLLDQLAQQGSKDLSLGLQDAQNTMASMGLGRSGQGQSTAAGVWRDIQERNAAERQGLMAQFRQSAMDREAGTMTQMGLGALNAEAAGEQAMGQSAMDANARARLGMGQSALDSQTRARLGMGQSAMDANARAIMGQQQGNINALLAAQQGAIQGNESRLGRAYDAGMQGQNALTGSLEASRGAERQALMGGQDRTAQWNLGQQGNYLQSLLGHDQASLNRMVAESQEQSRGMRDYAALQGIKDQMRSDRLNEMLGLEDRYRTGQNEAFNQMGQYSMMPVNWLMSMMTGIQPTGASQARTSPWGQMAAQAGMNYGAGLLGQMGQGFGLFGDEQLIQ